MKIAHLSDLHYCPKHLKWVDKAMTDAVNRAIVEDCDCAIISGDSFDRAMPLHEPAVAAYYRQVLQLANYMPVAVLSGTLSHDPVGCLEVLKHVTTKHEILVIDEPGAWVLCNNNTGLWHKYIGDVLSKDRLLLCGLPSLNKAEKDIMDIGPKSYAAKVMADFAPMADQARAAGIPSVLTTHGEILGSVSESNHAMISPDHEFTEDVLFSSGCRAIMIGHIHKHQEFWSDEGQVMAYPGSIARLTFGDHNPKGFLLWGLSGSTATNNFIEVPSRNLIEVSYDGPPDMDELKAVADDAGPDDSVRIRWVIDQEYAGSVDEKHIKALFAHVETLKLERSILPIQSVRSEEMLKATTLEQKICVWLDSTGDTDSAEKMAHLLGVLKDNDVDAIIGGEV